MKEGLYAVKTEAGAFLNLVVGSKTFRLAEFKTADDAVSFGLGIVERNPELEFFFVEHE